MRAAVTPTELADLEKRERLALLRRRMEAVPGRTAGTVKQVLPVPAALSGLLPGGGLARGTVAAYSGPDSLLLGVLAAATEVGHTAAIGKPGLGLLAAAEMGARLERIAVIANPGSARLEVASILLDGLDLVVLELSGANVAPSQAKVLSARARSSGAVLLVTGGEWAYPELRMRAQTAGFAGIGRGTGRLSAISLDVKVTGKGFQQRSARIQLDDAGTWAPETTAAPSLSVAS